MDQPLEDELLLHIAAGTDLPTAFAALPREEPEPPPASQGFGWAAGVVLVGIVIAFWWLFR